MINFYIETWKIHLKVECYSHNTTTGPFSQKGFDRWSHSHPHWIMMKREVILSNKIKGNEYIKLRLVCTTYCIHPERPTCNVIWLQAFWVNKK